MKQAVDQLNKVPNSAVAQKTIADLWAIAVQLAGNPVIKGHVAQSDGFEHLKQAWRNAQQVG